MFAALRYRKRKNEHIKTMKNLRKNKSAIEEGGFGVIVKIIITLVVGGVFFWLAIKFMGIS